MKILFITLSLVVACNCLAQECVYDQDNQFLLLEQLAEKYPGAVLDRQARTIIWADSTAKASKLLYGGCDHLSFVVAKSYQGSSALSQNQIFAISRELAAEFWGAVEAELLEQALTQNSYSLENIDGKTHYTLHNEYYTELAIEYDPAGKSVTISWMRNF